MNEPILKMEQYDGIDWTADNYTIAMQIKECMDKHMYIKSILIEAEIGATIKYYEVNNE